MSYELIRKKIAYFQQFPTSVYLDSAATALKPDLLWHSLRDVYAMGGEIIHRGTHSLVDRATQNYEEIRARFAKRFSVDPSEIIFTSGATAGLNRVACDWGLANLREGDEILTTVVEHHSSLLPWFEISRRTGASVRHVGLRPGSFVFDIDDFVFTLQTKVLVVSAFSNVLGDVWQSHTALKKLIDRAHAAGVVVVVDAAQQAPFYGVNLRELNPDFYAFSAHKMMGTTGLGILFVNKRVALQLQPLVVGGGAVMLVDWKNVHYKKGPEVLEAGTPMAAQVIAWDEVVRWLDSVIDYDVERVRLGGLMKRIVDTVQSLEGGRVLGNSDAIVRDGHLVSFVIDGIHAHDLADLLNSYDVFVRAGTMCAQPLHDFLDIAASVRVSAHWYTSPSDVEKFCSALKASVERLRDI